ncbi:hypothetical protein X743_16870 [Mesorhizobium sp. LNHC252B00]|nr:hypothetical protein X743_16870 [Mesorhizobium sp. LNHC252B00]
MSIALALASDTASHFGNGLTARDGATNLGSDRRIIGCVQLLGSLSFPTEARRTRDDQCARQFAEQSTVPSVLLQEGVQP